jgi:hypothetical protein
MCVIRRTRQDHKFEASLIYIIETLSQKTNKQKAPLFVAEVVAQW